MVIRRVRKAGYVGDWLSLDGVSYLVGCLAVSVPFELVAVRPLTYIAYISHATGPRGKKQTDGGCTVSRICYEYILAG